MPHLNHCNRQQQVSYKLGQEQKQTGKVGECSETHVWNIPQVNRIIRNVMKYHIFGYEKGIHERRHSQDRTG